MLTHCSHCEWHLQKCWYKWRKTSHSGRRTGSTSLLERAVGIRTLMVLVEHSNMATTQRYIDLRPTVIEVAIELV